LGERRDKESEVRSQYVVSKDKAVQPEQLGLEQLQAEADEIRTRINRFRTSLGRFFVNKQPLIDLMCVAAVAQEPLLLVGPPGTAKSDLVLKFKDALGLADNDYFEYMLTRFTEPSEIIGPIDINQLRDGRYIRREQGKLPTARIVFLDIDGVLNGHQFNEDADSCSIDPACVQRLNSLLLRNDASYVITSAWRYMISGGAMTHIGFEYMLRTHGVASHRMAGYARKDFDYFFSQLWLRGDDTRGEQIANWLVDCSRMDAPYVVLDDLPPCQFLGHPFVRTDGARWLTDGDVRHADLYLRLQGVKRGRTRHE
jgi:hypothetical protein